MNDIKSVDLLELVDRYNYLMKSYIPLATELVPKWEKFGKLRQELQLISVEFMRRGFDPKEDDSLKKMIEEELQKRSAVANENKT